MKARRWIIISLILILTLVLSSCNSCNWGSNLIDSINRDLDIEYSKNKTLESIDLELPKDNKIMINSIIETNEEDYRQEVPAYFNISVINKRKADLKGVTYLEYLLGDRYTMDELEHEQKVIKQGELTYYRVFLLNNTYLLYSTYSSKQTISDWWHNTDYNISYNVLPETSIFESGHYIVDENGNYDMLVKIDELVSEFYLSDTTTYICSHIWRNQPNLRFNEYEGSLYLPSHDNPYYAFIEPKDKTMLEYKIHKDTKVVADFAFGECSNVERIVFEDNKTCIGIGNRAFYGCDNLKSCNFPSSLNEIYDNLLSDIPNIEKYSTENATYLGNEEDNHVILCSVDPKVNDFTFEKDTKIIYSLAFNECTNISKLIIPDNITYIGKYALVMTSLIDLEIGSGVKRIEECAFISNKNLKNITINSHRVTFGKDIFDEDLENLYFNGTTNEWLENKFTGNIFPDDNSIKIYTKNDSSFHLLEDVEAMKDIPSYAFANYKYINSVKLGNKVSVIGKNSFFKSTIKKITLGNSLELIEKDAFAYCKNLDRTTYQGTIDEYCEIVYQSPYSNPTFYSCNLYLIINDKEKKINEIVIGDNIKVINDYAFYNVKTVSKITIGKNVKEIGYCAFAGTDRVTDIYIVGRVEMIRDYAFRSKGDSTLYLSSEDISSNYERLWDYGVFKVIWNYK